MKLANIFLIILIALAALAGCERAQKTVLDVVPTNPTIDDSVSDLQAIPVKLLWFIDYPEGGKEAYIAWVASIAPTLQTPEEIVRIRSYDNREPDMSPHRLVEFEFNSFLDAATYLNRSEIAAVLEDLPNHSSKANVHTLIQRSDYSKIEEGNWEVKSIYLVDYSLGGKAAYLEWVASVSSILIEPSQLKAISAYDNYYGESPHRLVALEFASQEDLEIYEQLEEIMAVEAELDNQAGSWVNHVFELRSDYISQ